LKTMRRTESITLGRRLLNHALGELNIDQIEPVTLDKVLKDLRLKDVDSLLAAIGLGELMSVVVARRLLGTLDEETQADDKRRMPIRGADGILLTFANCCHPIHGDPIMAYVSPGKGLVIHREECANIRG